MLEVYLMEEVAALDRPKKLVLEMKCEELKTLTDIEAAVCCLNSAKEA
jgi:hypothetical protein